MRKLILLSALSAAAACAQSISVGIIAGAPLTNVISSKTIGGVKFDPQSLHLTVGGAFQLDLPFRLRFEADALYRPASFSASNLVSNISAANWKFPVMMKYRFINPIGGGLVQPFAGAGFTFDHLYQVTNAIKSGPGSIVKNSPGGILLVGGVDLKVLGKRLSAELRYTRQQNDSILNLSQLNQADFLLGLHF